jgi:hypothetical protein
MPALVLPQRQQPWVQRVLMLKASGGSPYDAPLHQKDKADLLRPDLFMITLVSLGYWQGCFALLVAIYLIVSLRTNLVFVAIFAFLIPTFSVSSLLRVSGCYVGAASTHIGSLSQLLTVAFAGTNLSANTIKHCFKAAGALAFIVSLLGWYLLLSILLVEVDGGSECGSALPVSSDC